VAGGAVGAGAGAVEAGAAQERGEHTGFFLVADCAGNLLKRAHWA